MKFKVGDKVRITDQDYIYASYSEMSNKLKLKNKGSEFDLGTMKRDEVFAIFGASKHHHNDDIVYAIRNKYGKEFLFDEKGLTLAEQKTTITKSKKYWIAVNESGTVMTSGFGLPYLHSTKKDASKYVQFPIPVRVTLTWNIERKKK